MKETNTQTTERYEARIAELASQLEHHKTDDGSLSNMLEQVWHGVVLIVIATYKRTQFRVQVLTLQSALLSSKHDLEVCQRQLKAATTTISDREDEIESFRQKAAADRLEYQSIQQSSLETKTALERQIYALRAQLAVCNDM